MSKLLQNKSINKINFLSAIISGVLLVLFIMVIFFNSYIQYKHDIKKIESDYLISQKEFVEQETLRALRYIKYRYETNSALSTKELQKDIVQVIENTRYKTEDGTGYVFIYTFDGINIADPILKQNAGKNLLHFKDPNGKEVISELIKVSKNKEGGYVEYVWNKPTTNTLAPKISYAISFEPWRWMIGSGVYLDNVKEKLDERKKIYSTRIGYYIIQIMVMVTILYMLGVLLYRYLMLVIQNDIKQIKESSENLNVANIDTLSFKEFKEVGMHLNEMTNSLKDLNKNLEEKVRDRTIELEESKEYAMDLVQKQDRFIKDAIHEINTPLGIIIANIDLFNMKNGKNKYLSKIEAGSKIIHNIYNDLEYMIKKDRIEYKVKTINLSNFVIDRNHFFEEIAVGNDLELILEIVPNLIIEFNDILLQRVIDNTLSNAIKYSYPKSEIKMSLKVVNDKAVLQISNRSDTIKNPDKLFSRYYRENSSRGGFGIGLNIIKDICDKNNVVVNVASFNNKTTFSYNFKMVKG
jgi:signal transduction histidine kinase